MAEWRQCRRGQSDHIFAMLAMNGGPQTVRGMVSNSPWCLSKIQRPAGLAQQSEKSNALGEHHETSPYADDGRFVHSLRWHGRGWQCPHRLQARQVSPTKRLALIRPAVSRRARRALLPVQPSIRMGTPVHITQASNPRTPRIRRAFLSTTSPGSSSPISDGIAGSMGLPRPANLYC